MGIIDFGIHHIDMALAMWRTDDGIGLSGADEPASLKTFLERNRGLSKVAISEGSLVGTLLCGGDGRRGYLYHLWVDETLRRHGIGTQLVQSCLTSLKEEQITKCHLFVFRTNEAGKTFWKATDWARRHDILVFSREP